MRGATKARPDYVLFSTIAILVVLGIIIIASVSAPISQQKFGSPNFYLFRHLLFGMGPGLLFGFIVYKISLDFWRKRIAVLLLINLFLMALVFFPIIGIKLGGASRWLNIGFTSLQPSEFLKLTFILYLANWLPSLKTRDKKNLSKTLIGFSAVTGLAGLLLFLQRDIGTFVVIAASGILIYFLSGTPIRHNLAILFGALAILAIMIKVEPYRLERIMVFLNPNIEPMGISYQVKQAEIAIGSGGVWGNGLGMGLQKFVFLPEPMSDLIFAVFAEEMGFIGAFILIFLFLIFIWRGFKIAKQAHDSFYRLACIGITFWITIQAFVNMGAAAGILPLTGIPLPFLSYGGSALVAELIGVGILLNISKHSLS